jgi:GNAT superfamily N-acetyltransferase
MVTRNDLQSAGWREKLHDGSRITIRAISKDDEELELAFLKDLSPEFQRLRFLGLVRDPDAEVVHELTNIDPRREAGFIAVASRDGEEVEIGAARLRVDADKTRCDCAVTVSEPWQGRGVGSLLMRYLVEEARVRGIRHMYAVDPIACEKTHQLALRLGFRRRPDPDDPAAMIYDLDLDSFPGAERWVATDVSKQRGAAW